MITLPSHPQPRNVWQHPQRYFWLLQWEGEEDASRILWVEAREAAKNPTVCGPVSHTRSYLVQNIKSTKDEKPQPTEGFSKAMQDEGQYHLGRNCPTHCKVPNIPGQWRPPPTIIDSISKHPSRTRVRHSEPCRTGKEGSRMEQKHKEEEPTKTTFQRDTKCQCGQIKVYIILHICGWLCN